MNDPTRVRSERFKAFLESRAWKVVDLAAQIIMRREDLSLTFTHGGSDEATLRQALTRVFEGRELLLIELAAEIAAYNGVKAEELYASFHGNDEGDRYEHVVEILTNVGAYVISDEDGEGDDASKGIRDLRSAVLRTAMDAKGMGPAALADALKAKRRLKKKERNLLVQRINLWKNGTSTLPDEEISDIAEILEVTVESLRVRDLTESERAWQQRGLKAAESRRNRKGSKRGAASKGDDTTRARVPRVRTPVQILEMVSATLHFDATDLGNAVIDAESRNVSIDNGELVIRIPLPAALVMKALQN